jgi:hypothetical protein
VFFGFGVLPLVCAAVLWTLLGPIRFGAAGFGDEENGER